MFPFWLVVGRQKTEYVIGKLVKLKAEDRNITLHKEGFPDTKVLCGDWKNEKMKVAHRKERTVMFTHKKIAYVHKCH